MILEKDFNIKNFIREVVGTIIGSFIIAISISLFLLPNKLSTGGFSGLATITYYLFNIPAGTFMLVLNIQMALVL